MPYLAVVCLALVHGLSFLLPVGENMHIAVLPRLLGWPPQPLPQHLACHAGTVISLVIVLRREVGRALKGAWQLVRGRWRPETGLFVSLTIALLPIGVLRALGAPIYVSSFGLGRIDYLAMTGILMAALMWLADRYSLAIRRIEHMSPVDGLVLGLAQLLAFFPGTGLAPLSMMTARLLGFERPDAVRIAFLVALAAFAGEVLLSGSRLYLAGQLHPAPELAIAAAAAAAAGLFAASALLEWLKRRSLAPFLVYRLLASAAVLVWFYMVFRG
ncbi:MAG TPA: undecaprenyl-diphosphate phosphatase [Alphaproteobacteria bacterium]|nr:undecaprenyl-diphosphate phosphatase [Alphaproteobacteria bacterium]